MLMQRENIRVVHCRSALEISSKWMETILDGSYNEWRGSGWDLY